MIAAEARLARLASFEGQLEVTSRWQIDRNELKVGLGIAILTSDRVLFDEAAEALQQLVPGRAAWEGEVATA